MVRVIIERHCRQGKDVAIDIERFLVDLRIKAIHQHGYISGETLRSVDDPLHWLVISTWVNVDHWKAWEAMPERRQIISKMEPLLTAPEKVSVFSFSRRGGARSAHTIDR